jgi:uncharacterized membrane protein
MRSWFDTYFYSPIVFIHVVAAMIWVGGNLFFFALGPRLRRDTEHGMPALRIAGRTFRTLSWAAIWVMLATGLYFLAFGWPATTGPLAVKLVLVVMALGVKASHDYWVAPNAARLRGPWATAAHALARVNLVLALGIVYVAGMLRR